MNDQIIKLFNSLRNAEVHFSGDGACYILRNLGGMNYRLLAQGDNFAQAAQRLIEGDQTELQLMNKSVGKSGESSGGKDTNRPT